MSTSNPHANTLGALMLIISDMEAPDYPQNHDLRNGNAARLLELVDEDPTIGVLDKSTLLGLAQRLKHAMYAASEATSDRLMLQRVIDRAQGQ